MDKKELLNNKIKILNENITKNYLKIKELSSINYETELNNAILEQDKLEKSINYEYKYKYDISSKKIILEENNKIKEEKIIYNNEIERYNLKNIDLEEEYKNNINYLIQQKKEVIYSNEKNKEELKNKKKEKEELITKNYNYRKKNIILLKNIKLDKKNKKNNLIKYDSILKKLKKDKEFNILKIEEIEKDKKNSNQLYYQIKNKKNLIKTTIDKIDNDIQLNIINNIDISELIDKKETKIKELDSLILNPDNNILEKYKNYDILINKKNKELDIINNNIYKLNDLLTFNIKKINNNKKNSNLDDVKNKKLIHLKKEILKYNFLINENNEKLVLINSRLEEKELFYKSLFDKELVYKNNCISRKEIATKRINDKFIKKKKNINITFKNYDIKNNAIENKISNIKKKIVDIETRINLEKEKNKYEIERLQKDNFLKKKEIINIKIRLNNLY